MVLVETAGVESFHVDQKNSKVTVYGTVKPQVVLEKVLRAGKTAELWPEEATKEPFPVKEVVVVVGGKKKASDEGGNATKKQKNGKAKEEFHESKEEIESEDGGDGEVLDETEPASVPGEDESDERVLIKSKKPAKKGIFRKG